MNEYVYVIMFEMQSSTCRLVLQVVSAACSAICTHK